MRDAMRDAVLGDQPCSGVLIVHGDGEVLCCSEQTGARLCLGAGMASRHRRVTSCREAFPVSHCPHCARRRPEPGPDPFRRG